MKKVIILVLVILLVPVVYGDATNRSVLRQVQVEHARVLVVATSDPFEQAVPIADLNSPSDERDPWLSPDGVARPGGGGGLRLGFGGQSWRMNT